MIKKYWNRLAGYSAKVSRNTFKSHKMLAMTVGTMCGIIFLALFFQLFATLGMSLGIVTGCFLTVAVCVDQGVRRYLCVDPHPSTAKINVMTMALLAGFVVLSPYTMDVVRFGIGFVSMELMVSPVTLIVIGCISTILLLVAPLLLSLACISMLSSDASKLPSYHLATVRYFFTGMGFGVLCAAFVTTPVMGTYIAAIVACLVLLVLAVCLGIITSKSPTNQERNSQTLPAKILSEQTSILSWPNFWPTLFVLICGAMMTVICRELQQTMATSLYLICAQWAALLLGFSWGMKRRWISARQNKDERRAFLWAGLMPAVWLSLCLLAFPLLVELVLYMNATVSWETLHLILRGTIAGILVLPLGFVVGHCSLNITESELSNSKKPTTQKSFRVVFRSLYFVVGMLVVRWAGLNIFTLAQLMIAMSIFGLVATIVFCAKERYILKTMSQRGMAVAGMMVVIAGVLWQPSDNFAFSSRLLFSSEFFLARKRGVERDQIPFLDEARQLVTVEGENGTYSLWRYRGSQIQLRESGVPQGVVSTDPRTCRQLSSEILPTVMPLVMHSSPRKVLVLGMGVSTPLFTAHSFPIESLTCVESDETLIDLNREMIWKESNRDLLADKRVKILPVDPSLALLAKSEFYDVIISNPIHSSLMRAAPYFTKEFYRTAASSLAKEGIFSQRFHKVDYGSFPMKSVVQSMQLAFSEVMVIEIGSGDMVLLGTNSELGLNRSGLIDRLQAPHVRIVLSEIGWDWSLPLNLVAFDNEILKKFVQTGNCRTNSTANAWFATSLPKEVMRWGPKWRELRENLFPSASRLLAAKHIDANEPSLLRRIAEVVGQKQLMVSYPDQFWAYRQTVKQQITSKPSELIKQISAKSKLDGFSVQDKWRMGYFSALEKAAKNATLDVIEKIEEHEFPYDPLISYFLHQEVAELYAKSETKNRSRELQHRLHAVFYGQDQDRSIRNVADAIGLLVDHADASESPIQRWDDLNALVQVMKNRWEIRGLIRPKSAKIVLNDLKYSIRALESAKRTMNEIQPHVSVKDEHWKNRKIVIEQQLIRPLRTYRKNLLDYHMKKQARTKRLLDKIDE